MHTVRRTLALLSLATLTLSCAEPEPITGCKTDPECPEQERCAPSSGECVPEDICASGIFAGEFVPRREESLGADAEEALTLVTRVQGEDAAITALENGLLQVASTGGENPPQFALDYWRDSTQPAYVETRVRIEGGGQECAAILELWPDIRSRFSVCIGGGLVGLRTGVKRQEPLTELDNEQFHVVRIVFTPPATEADQPTFTVFVDDFDTPIAEPFAAEQVGRNVERPDGAPYVRFGAEGNGLSQWDYVRFGCEALGGACMPHDGIEDDDVDCRTKRNTNGCPDGRATQPESCNDADDDCDGAIDENFINQPPPSDGSTPRGAKAQNAAGIEQTLFKGDPCIIGVCTDARMVCHPNGEDLRCQGVGELPAESCDGLDNDCDGASDEDFLRDSGIPAADLILYDDPQTAGTVEALALTESCGLGACALGGVVECNPDALNNPDLADLRCSVRPTEELCGDDIDNNCNGVTDEDFDRDGDGFQFCPECDPQRRGADDMPVPIAEHCQPAIKVDCDDSPTDDGRETNPDATEVCNQTDDDCDGIVDEGFDRDGDLFWDCGRDCEDLDIRECEEIDRVCNPECDGPTRAFCADTCGADPPAELVEQCERDCALPCCPIEPCCNPTSDCNDEDPAINPNAQERCNRVDDNCDNNVDEVFRFGLRGDYNHPLHCGECGNSCRDQDRVAGGQLARNWVPECDSDNASPPAFNCAQECRPNFFNLNLLNDDGCECQRTVDPEEDGDICNGINDDCDADGRVDEDGDVPCYTGAVETRGVGLCRDGLRLCADGVLPGEAPADCTDQVAPDVEVCNGLDDDCDGTADEDFDLDGDGFPTCGVPCDPLVGDNLSPDLCDPDCDDDPDTGGSVNRAAPEVCNEVDDDCDILIDEDFGEQRNGITVYTDADHCGVCNVPCRLPNSIANCDSGTCEVLACTPGFSDRNRENIDGCEVESCEGAQNSDRLGNPCSKAMYRAGEPGNPACQCTGFFRCNEVVGEEERDPTVQCLINDFAEEDDYIPANECPALFERIGGTDELCNSSDDDCDGRIDEDFKQSDIYFRVEHCGECNNVCAFERATPLCNDGLCVQGPCEDGFHDLDEEPGCEYPCVVRPPQGGELPRSGEVCNGFDDDCDGRIDEGFDKDTESANCGICGRVCSFANASAACVDGDCVQTDCTVNFADCTEADGCETPTANDFERCGGCDPCDADAADRCVGGACRCGNNEPCAGDTPVCDRGVCVGCVENRHCQDAEFPYCVNNLCTECDPDAQEELDDCGELADRPICGANGNCRECNYPSGECGGRPGARDECVQLTLPDENGQNRAVNVCRACELGSNAGCSGTAPICVDTGGGVLACARCDDLRAIAAVEAGQDPCGADSECTADGSCSGCNPLNHNGCANPTRFCEEDQGGNRECRACESNEECTEATGGDATQCILGRCEVCNPGNHSGCGGDEICCDFQCRSTSFDVDGAGAGCGACGTFCDALNSSTCTDRVCTCGEDAEVCRGQVPICDREGGGDDRCVNCSNDGDCQAPAGQCVARICRPCDPANNDGCDDPNNPICDADVFVCRAACDDGVQNGTETDTDCGGDCPACADNRACVANSDCESSVCQGQTCRAPRCNDQTKNGAETDIDCGGPACDPCGDNLSCLENTDCANGVCNQGRCSGSSCVDQIRNGLETDADCGGPTCDPCTAGEGCAAGRDCDNGVCNGGACAGAGCGDGVQNGAETDTDCGGPTCDACPDNQGCVENRDCESGVCQGNSCRVPTCNDNTTNGVETDEDCGGNNACDRCPNNAACVAGSDCVSAVCSGGSCGGAGCGDGVRNGDETAVDCGGSCPRCADNLGCLEGADCQSRVCTGNSCAEPACDDEFTNGDETDEDCGGATCDPCTAGEDCGQGSDCDTGVCNGGACAGAGCGDGVQNGAETDVDCGGNQCDRCVDNRTCSVDNDCVSLQCGGGTCDVPACNDGVANGQETDTDCGGPSCPKCADNSDCLLARDCTSGRCDANTCVGAGCADGVQNGDETDTDCGGSCADCADNLSCSVNGDCQSAVCDGDVCQVPTCLDNTTNGQETGQDCGGPLCPKCAANLGCDDGDDCQSGVCTTNVCREPTCNDEVQNGGETDVDCGGGCNADCADNLGCGNGADCQSGVCTAGVCQVPACDDGVVNGTETGEDGGNQCGGSCPTCPDNQPCGANRDCDSGQCGNNDRCTAPACNDGVQNGDETDVDCGGSCSDCADNLGCDADGDCVSIRCVGNVCQAPTCNDSRFNGDETDEDCGGPCDPCANGDDCVQDEDCISLVCPANSCAVPACNDEVKNGSETDVDCGGGCPDCADNLGCGVDGDCESNKCTANVCAVPACNDSRTNGAETDQDCGGPVCDSCVDGDVCAAARDCTSGVCGGGTCSVAACNDSVQNGNESDVDCGGACGATCEPNRSCGANGDCASGVCTGGACQAPACDDAVQNGDETDVNCGGDTCAPCGNGLDCGDDVDCESGVCTLGSCAGPGCGDNVRNGDETDVDCGGGCPNCADNLLCGADGDCASDNCTGGRCSVPACDDSKQNGSETDEDCGGSCPVCADGDTCSEDDDCDSGVCNVTCQVAACDDTVENGDETDIDCGGACPDCADNLRCLVDGDCDSQKCTGGRCAPPACDDSRFNGVETDQDCGGAVCDACADGDDCQADADCESGLCNANTCAVPACNDSRLNGDETDIDCGGSCPACGDNLLCGADNGNCESGVCNGRCTPPACDDSTQNGAETGEDCGANCPACADGLGCAANDDCSSGVCNLALQNPVCVAPTCDDDVENAAETDVDCGGGTCDDCADNLRCTVPADCQSGVCEASGRCGDTCATDAHCSLGSACVATVCVAAKLAFVYSTPHDGDFDVGNDGSGLDDADTLCGNEATANSLPGTWVAWLSDSNTDASARVTQHNAPFMLTNQTRLADDYADLTDGSIAVALNIGADGEVDAPSPVWTATTIAGAATATHCSDWGTAAPGQNAGKGANNGSNNTWTDQAPVATCDTELPFYCFQE